MLKTRPSPSVVRKKKNKSVLCASETDAGREVCVKETSSYADGVIVKILEPLVISTPAAAAVEDEELREVADDTGTGTRLVEPVVNVPFRETDDAMLLDRDVVSAEAEVLLIPMKPSGDKDVVLDVMLEVPFLDVDEDADEDDREPLENGRDVVVEDDVEFDDPVADVCDVCEVEDVVPTKMIAAEFDCEEEVEEAEDATEPELVEDAVGDTVDDGMADPEASLEDGVPERVDVTVPDPEVRVEEEVEVSNEVPSTPTDISTETAAVEAASTEASPVTPTACLR